MTESLEALRKRRVHNEVGRLKGKVIHALPPEHDTFRQKQLAVMVERMDSLSDLDALQKK